MKHKILPHLYQTVAEEALFGIVVFNDAGECLFVNNTAKQMLGVTEPTIENLIPASAHSNFKTFSRELLRHDGLYQDIIIKRSEHLNFVATLGIKSLEVDGISAHLLMLEDVTLQKKLQREITHKQNEIKATFEALLNQNQKLRASDLAKDRFIAITTHELRTPLSAMVASAEILKLKLYDTPEQMKEFTDIIYDQGLHLLELVNDILDFAKIQAGKMDYYIELHDVAGMAQSLLHNFEGMAGSHSVKLKFEPPAQPVQCYYDELRLRQVLSNMINNAIKYNRTNGQVRLHFQQNAECVKVLIEDTGPGVAPDQIHKVFDEFETIGHVAQHHEGTGLGMPISRKLMEGMGGKLLLTSKERVGSVFWVEIPKTKILEASVYRARPEKGGDFAA